MSQDAAEQTVHMWKVNLKKLIKSPNNARGAGTSMISLILPPKDRISRASAMLTEEYGTHLTSRLVSIAFLCRLRSPVLKKTLKSYNRVPPNGLMLFVGTILTDEEKEEKVSFDFEPHKPINTFHTEALQELLVSELRFGSIVMDGNGTLIGILSRAGAAGEEIIVHANKEQGKNKFMDKSTGLEMEQVEEPQSLLGWFADKYRDFGANLEFVTNRSQEGARFVKGFGIGGLLRYKVDFTNTTLSDEEEGV